MLRPILLALCLIALAPTAGRAAPAWWTVSSGASKVYILGAPATLPKDMAWDSRMLEARLAGANALIMPAAPKFDVIKIAKFFLTNRKSFEANGPMEATLPPPLRARFIAARTQMGQDAGHYAHWRPGIASMILAGDFRKHARIVVTEPEGRVKSLAGKAHAKVQRVPGIDVLPFFEGLTGLSEAAHQACLADSISEVEGGAGRIAAAAQGWARGDVAAAMTAEHGYEQCLAMVPGARALGQRGEADTAAAIAQALSRPGASVALVQLRPLLEKGGVLDHLRARGFTVTGPAP